MDTKGKIAVVTGAGGGIGGALVKRLRHDGARAVVAVDLNRSGLDMLEREIAADTQPIDGTESLVLYRLLDVCDEQGTQALVREIAQTVGDIDIWFANAGVSGGAGPDAPDETWQFQWQANVMSHVYASRALLPHWLARGEGYLVTTASMAGLLTSLGEGVYAATKHAAVGFAEWMAITYQAEGIKVSCVCPGAVDTGMLRGFTGGNGSKSSEIIGGGDVLPAEGAAEAILAGVRDERFLILTHPEMQGFMVRKAEDPERWIRGMARLWGRKRSLLGQS